jgi:hypothetical protein
MTDDGRDFIFDALCTDLDSDLSPSGSDEMKNPSTVKGTKAARPSWLHRWSRRGGAPHMVGVRGVVRCNASGEEPVVDA